MNELAKKIVKEIFSELGDRRGIGDELDQISDDEEVYEEMLESCIKRVVSCLNVQKK